MEALGGVGYLDNTENESLNISRIYRDCCVLSIWEGTTDVLSSDTIRVLKGRAGEEVVGALDRWIAKSLSGRSTEEGKIILGSWKGVKDILKFSAVEDLLPQARDLTFKLADIVMGVLLVVDAEVNPDPMIATITSRFLKSGGGAAIAGGWKDTLAVNQKIVYGEASDGNKSAMSKL